MIIRKYSLLILFLISGCATSPSLKDSPRRSPSMAKINTLIVVHPTNFFDDNEARTEINNYVEGFLRSKQKVFTLVETNDQIEDLMNGTVDQGSGAKYYKNYLSLIEKTTLVQSTQGEHEVLAANGHFTVIGGYFRACLRTALMFLVKGNLKDKDEIHVHLPLNAIYGKSQFFSPKLTEKESLILALKKRKPKHVHLKVQYDGELIYEYGAEQKKTINLYIESSEDVRSVGNI